MNIKMNANVKRLNSRPARNAQNKFITATLHRAHCAVEKLIQGGHTVLDVNIHYTQPIITIQYHNGCDRLNGDVFLITSKGSVMGTTIFNCNVGWLEPSHVQQLRHLKSLPAKNDLFKGGKYRGNK